MSTYQDSKWKQLMATAYSWAAQSNDPSTQNGAIIIDIRDNEIGRGFNGLTRGVESTADKWERPIKYDWVEHAERNAIYSMRHRGEGKLTMVACWAACTDCARAIVQSHIQVLVRHKGAHDRTPDHWAENIAIADQILKAGGVEVVTLDVKVFPELRHTGEVWVP